MQSTEKEGMSWIKSLQIAHRLISKAQVCVSHLLLRPKRRRVRFSCEVQQVLCLPQAFTWGSIPGLNLLDEQVYSSSSLENYTSWQSLLPLQPACLKAPEGPFQRPLSLNSPSFCEGEEEALTIFCLRLLYNIARLHRVDMQVFFQFRISVMLAQPVIA